MICQNLFEFTSSPLLGQATYFRKMLDLHSWFLGFLLQHWRTSQARTLPCELLAEAAQQVCAPLGSKLRSADFQLD